MFISRKLDPQTHEVELWECEWLAVPGKMAEKRYIQRIGPEDFTVTENHEYMEETDAILWSPGRTIGNIAINSESIIGSFDEKNGENAIVPCDIIRAGKFRHGAPRWYCKTHQTHWGTKADFVASQKSGEMLCGNHTREMSYIVNPPIFNFDDYAEIGIWCSLPPALSSQNVTKRSPRIHIHVRNKADDHTKEIDKDFMAVSLAYSQSLGLFASGDISKIHVTPPAAFEFVRALEEGIALDCVNCSRCGYPHLDLGDFGMKPHRKHFCGNCGSDSIWSKVAIISTPLKPIHDQFSKSNTYVVPDRVINIDDYNGCDFEIWSSTPAVLWTADRAQEKGIHVHIYRDGKRIIDDTFGVAVYRGSPLDRGELWKMMKSNVIV